MNRAIHAASEGFVGSISLALTLPAKIVSAALAVVLAFVHHQGDTAPISGAKCADSESVRS